MDLSSLLNCLRVNLLRFSSLCVALSMILFTVSIVYGGDVYCSQFIF